VLGRRALEQGANRSFLKPGINKERLDTKVATRKISLTINGARLSGRGGTAEALVDFIRDDLGLTGTHVGCRTRRLARALSY
jgi:hypothetical protein